MQGGSHVNCVEIYTYYDGKILPVKDYEYGYNGYGGSGSVKYISKQNVILRIIKVFEGLPICLRVCHEGQA